MGFSGRVCALIQTTALLLRVSGWERATGKEAVIFRILRSLFENEMRPV